MVFIETSVFTRQIRDLIILLLAYAKSRTNDLSQAQIKMLGEIVKLEIKWVEDGTKTV